MNAANAITTLRILLTPVFVYALIDQRYAGGAWVIFCVCILTDVLDGFVARFWHTKTATGKFLDPLADKFLLLSSYFALTFLHKIPMWLFVLILARDVIIVSGWLTIYILINKSKINVRMSGKIAVVVQMATILAVMLSLPYTDILFPVTGIITALSIVDYCAKELRVQ